MRGRGGYLICTTQITPVTEAQNGNSKCFEELYELYYKKIYAVIKTTVRHSAVQNTERFTSLGERVHEENDDERLLFMPYDNTAVFIFLNVEEGIRAYHFDLYTRVTKRILHRL